MAPELWGHVDLSRYHVAAATARNVFVNYRGGLNSRAGTAFVGRCKQAVTVGGSPPRDIPFRFSLSQGFVLEFGDNYMRIKSNGAYVLEPAFNITAATQANPCQITAPGHNYANGDWVFITGVGGMTQLNGNTYIVANSNTGAGTFTLQNLDGIAINSTGFGAYTSGGTVARLFTLATPYAAVDLPYLKFAQSADEMTLTLSNPTNGHEYAPYTLIRSGSVTWSLNPTNFGAVIAAPATCTATPSNNPDPSLSPPTQPTAYAYVVTAVDSKTGSESVASPIANVTNSVDMSVTAGSLTIDWSPVSGASIYNIYRAPPSYNTQPGSTTNALPVPAGSLFFYVGSSYGTEFVDSNITADGSKVPPQHKNPFAPGQVLAVPVTASSTDWTHATIAITTGTGTGFIGEVVIVGAAVVAVIVINPGQNYLAGDTPVFTGDGSSVTATVTVGPQTGTFPGVVAFFQQRQFFADSFNNPDTYYGSQTGSFTNMDSAVPPSDSDALVGTPWSEQVNGVQWLVSMPGGLLALTGNRAWQITGPGGSAINPQAITPSAQNAQPQAFYGISATLPPIVINYDVLYQEAAGSFVYDLNYNFWVSIYTGTDISWPSGHLFAGHQLKQWALCLKPSKVVWAVRDDGVLLSLTYLKEQEVMGWTRHTTQGLVQGVCSVTEPPVDALYLIVARATATGIHYFSERMDNRLWYGVEDPFCVDAGLRSVLPTRNATLVPNATSGTAIFSASAAVFSGGDVGSVIRMGGGIATVTVFTDSQHVTGTWNLPMTAIIPDSPNSLPVPQGPGAWTITAPFTVFGGLNHLSGQTVNALADGVPVIGLTVSGTGTITLPFAASNVVAGLGFIAQFQSLYLDPSQLTDQGRRKSIYAATARVASSGYPLTSNSNQADGSALSPPVQAPIWTGMQPLRPQPPGVAPATYTSPGGQTVTPLYTGDLRGNIPSTWRKPGQVAIQQTMPLPMNLLALVPEYNDGDTPESMISKDEPRGNANRGARPSPFGVTPQAAA